MRLEEDGEFARLYFAFNGPPSRSVVEFFISGAVRNACGISRLTIG